MTTEAPPTATTPGRGARLLDGIERVGNRLPDPFSLFLLLFGVVAVASSIMAALDLVVEVPDAEEPTPIRGFFTADGFTWLTTNLVDNFIGFPPLGVVLTILLAVGVAQRTGLLAAMVRRAFGRAPRWALPYVVGVISVAGNIMSDAAMVALPPLAAMVFAAAGRHPVAGLLGSFAAVTAGYSCSPFITSADALLSGITTSAAESLGNPGTAVTPVSNYFLMATIALLLGAVTGFLIDRVLEPSLIRKQVPRTTTADNPESAAAPADGRGHRNRNGDREWNDDRDRDDRDNDHDDTGNGNDAAALSDGSDLGHTELTDDERSGLRWAGVAFLATAFGVLALTLPSGAPMRAEDGSFLPSSPLLDSVVFLVFLSLIVPAIVYGIRVRTVRGGSSLATMMTGAVKDMSGFVVVAFVMAQFLALFNWSGLSSWLAVTGADLLQRAHFTGFGAIVAFVLLAAVINVFVISGSAQWALFAAVFVPMFALLGYEPGFIQAAFRIGDSSTNGLSPLNPYMVIILGFLRAYEPRAGLGTVISRALPFSLVFLILWIAVLAVFFVTGTPVGPGMGIHL
ncbi:AbgT family transporter [Phytoactinopolyspora halotolerans]|uniref:AbgT family transporter n=1 Tax=Phytoactinopolyspora halotolerans TaxID=1981512 RepID=A0A6L9S0P0_9ACTN|nr:AbgT family transporter [Phytoactinopolyspora halotolerans]NED98672.1 AbgT family transporter [Phytoactinopolyspora halotolerans]